MVGGCRGTETDRQKEREEEAMAEHAQKRPFSAGGSSTPFSKFVDDYHGFLINRP